MGSTFSGYPTIPPRSSRVLKVFLWTLGLALLCLGSLGVLIDYGSAPRFEATYSIKWGKQPSSSGHGTSITTRGGRTAQAVYSLMLMCGVGFIGAARGVDQQQYSLRALLATVLLVGVAGSVPYLLIRPLAMRATVQFQYTPFLPPDERAAVIAHLQRDTILSELPAADRERFDRVHFSVTTEAIGETGLRVVLGFPEKTPPALRDSITAFCGQYAQVLIHERLPWISPEAFAENMLQSEWSQMSSYPWEQAYRQRREQAKQNATPQPQRPPP